MPDYFDRVIGAIDGLPGVDKSRPSTVTTVHPIIGDSQTAVVQTYKTDDGFIAFVQIGSAEQYTRVVLESKVMAALYRQRDALITTGRKRRARDAWEQMDPDQRDAHVTRLRAARKAG